MDSTQALAFTERFKDTLRRMVSYLDAGMTTSTAYEIAFKEIDDTYRQLCMAQSVQPVNHMLHAPDVEMFARFGLDSLYGCKQGLGDEAECRKAFWLTFHRATRPTTLGVMPAKAS